MTLRCFFLIAFTLTHQAVFWFLLLMMVAFCRVGAERLVMTLMSPLSYLPCVHASTAPFSFFLANSFLWALSAWHALSAWRRLRNLPPLEARS
jgi:hypothetical protein